MISLEISDTELATRISPPRIFRELDWVENFWPNSKRGKGHQYPKVQLYCLMGVSRAWTVIEMIEFVEVTVSHVFAHIGLAY